MAEPHKCPPRVAFALAASVSFAHAQVICDPNVDFCPEEEDPGATFTDGTINIFTPFIPTDPYVVIKPPSRVIPSDPIIPPNPILVRPAR